jgi:hypothetical protein
MLKASLMKSVRPYRSLESGFDTDYTARFMKLPMFLVTSDLVKICQNAAYC